VFSLLGMLSVTYGVLILNSEFVVRRDRFQRHQRLVLATVGAIDHQLGGPVSASTLSSPAGQRRVREILSEFSATRVLVWLSRPNGLQPIFPETESTVVLRNPRLLKAAVVNANSMQSPRSFRLDGETYFTCSMPLKGGQGVLRFLEDVGVSPASRLDNLLMLLLIWLGLLAISGLLLIPLSRMVIQPLLRLEAALDEVSLTSSGSDETVEVSVHTQPQELQGIVEAFNRLASRLRDVWSQQHLLVNSLSHELVTPLALIRGGAKRLSRNTESWTSADRVTLMAVVEEAARADRLVRDFLDLARDGAGRLVVDREPFDPIQLMEKLVQDVHALPWGKRVQFHDKTDSSDRRILVAGNEERYRQCALNLLENASKYSGKSDPIEVVASLEVDQFLLSVIDQGPGIARDEYDKVFLPFYRSMSVSGAIPGTGIGLAIVKLLMQRMGGDVVVVDYSQPGACLQLRLAVSGFSPSDPSEAMAKVSTP
jgi:signal transduction histidine kinase